MTIQIEHNEPISNKLRKIANENKNKYKSSDTNKSLATI